MRLLIVGVGQTLNFETKQMEDVLQVLAPDGSVFSVPTTNEAAQGLVQIAMNGNGRQEDPFVKAVEEMPRKTAVVHGESMANSPYPIASTGNLSGEPFLEGAEVFGGQEGIGEEQDAPAFQQKNVEMSDAIAALNGEYADQQAEQVQQQIFTKTKSSASSKLGMRRNSSDRSGVPSLGISRVDEKGNPILPPAPSSFIEEDDDPGEQI